MSGVLHRAQRQADDLLSVEHREPSQTPLDPTVSLARHLIDERRWAIDQVTYVRGVLERLRHIGESLATPRRQRSVSRNTGP